MAPRKSAESLTSTVAAPCSVVIDLSPKSQVARLHPPDVSYNHPLDATASPVNGPRGQSDGAGRVTFGEAK